MRSLGSWSPRRLPLVAKPCRVESKDGIRIIKHVALDRQEKGRKIEQQYGQRPQHFSRILSYATGGGIDQVAEPGSNGKVHSEKLSNASENDKRQLRRRQFFFKQLQFLNRGHNGSSHAERDGHDGHEGPLENLSKDHGGSEDTKPISSEAQVPGEAKVDLAQRYIFSSQDSGPIIENGGSPAELESKNEDSQHVPHREQKRSRKTPTLSLFEDLFPEEAARQDLNENSVDQQDKEFPMLPLPDMIEDDADFEDEYVRGRKLDSETAEAASKDAYRLWKPSVLILQAASPSLDESDFRRIAPRGQHIEEWVGPGDFFKVIPSRDAASLKPKTNYWLVFPNPAYARAYQNQVIHLHNLARTHTPTSIESPMQPPKGMFLKGEEVYKLLQDYALCPPSRNISLLGLFPPLTVGMQRILHHKGYPELTQPRDKTGKAVLFWVEGFVPTMERIQQFISRDGRDRGMAWALMDGKDSIQQIDPDSSKLDEEEGAEHEHEHMESEGPGFRDYIRRTKIRWVIAFEDENEARRFVRRWHLRPFTSALDDREHTGDHAPLVHTEYMW